MAHELTIRADGRAEMAFAAGVIAPWHGLGQGVTPGASIGVWRTEAGLDWEAKGGTPSIMLSDWPAGNREEEVLFEDYKALYRSDTLAPLAIVGEGYNVVQPAYALEFFRSMCESGDWHIHTAGSLRGGRKIWAMAGRNQSAFVNKKIKDEIRHNVLFATSLDGSMKTTVADVKIAVVCANTLAGALNGNDRKIQISHRTVFDGEAVKRALGLADTSFDDFMRRARELADVPVNLSQARDILYEIFKPTPRKVKKVEWLASVAAAMEAQEKEPDDNRVVLDTLSLFQGRGMGAELKTRQGTMWGLLNAVTEHVDHHMGRSDESRLDSAWFGRGANFKGEALELICHEAGVA